VSAVGTSWLPWLWNLQELRLQHCRDITDSGLAQVRGRHGKSMTVSAVPPPPHTHTHTASP
jgi:hypothetical protein